MALKKIPPEIHFGQRVKIARAHCGLTQQELAQGMGLSCGQVAAIEREKRGISFEELKALAKVLKRTIYYFIDAFELVCEETPRYLLVDKVAKREIKDFEENILYKRLGAYRFLLSYYKAKKQLAIPKLDLYLPLTIKSSVAEAVNAGEQIANSLNLGTTPIDKLQTALEAKLGIMTLLLDTHPGIAGVSLRLPEVGFICVNRQQPKNKRSFAIAHELFHLLTGDKLAYDNTTPKKKIRKIEQLADYFASSLLIPRQKVTQITKKVGSKQTTTNLLVENITDLGVSAQALQVRIKQLEAATGRDLSAVFADLDLPKLEPQSKDSELPLPLAKLFVELMAKAVDEPLMPGMGAVREMGCKTFYEACDLFAGYGVAAPETMRFAMPHRRKGKKIFVREN